MVFERETNNEQPHTNTQKKIGKKMRKSYVYRIWTLTLSVHHSGGQTRGLLLHDVIASLTTRKP